MRVLLLNTFHYNRGGDCTHVFALAELLRAKGHEVRFFGMKHPLNVECADSEYWVDEIDFAELNSRKSLRAGAQVLGRTLYSRESRRRLERMLDAWTPDVAHIHNIHGHVSPSVLDSLAARKIPAVWTLHDYRLLCPNTHFLSHGRVCEECRGDHYYRCVANRCKKGSAAASGVAALEATVHRFLRIPDKVAQFIAPSEFLRSKFIEFGYPAEKLTFIRNFLPQAVAPLPSAPEGPATYVGQLASWKGVGTAIEAVASLPERRLVVVGDGPEADALHQQAASLGVAERVTFTGALDRAGVMRALAEAAFVVVPSVWYENCPYSVMEALAAGRPVVASEIGGLPELVVDGQSGITVPPGDPETLAGAMRALWEDQPLHERLSAGAVEASSEYDRESYYARLAEVYESALGHVAGRS